MYTITRLTLYSLIFYLVLGGCRPCFAQDATEQSLHRRSLIGLNYSRFLDTPHIGIKIQHPSFGLEFSFNARVLKDRGPFFSTHLVSLDIPFRFGKEPQINPLLGIGLFSVAPIGSPYWRRFLKPVLRAGMQITPSTRFALQAFYLRGESTLSGFSLNVLIPLKKIKNR